MMTGKDIVLLISTFLIGMFAGAYFYVSVFATSYESVLQGDVLQKSAFTIEGMMYGTCEEDDVCASFQLVEGREYSYLPFAEAEIEQGMLPSGFRNALKDALTLESLEYHARRGAQSRCLSSQGGVDYTYTISRDGEDFVLDSCTTLLSSNPDLQELLLSVWIAFENKDAEAPKVQLPELQLENAADIFFDRFHNGPQTETGR